MKIKSFEIRVCESCGLRYPLTDADQFGERCPACLGKTYIVLHQELIFPAKPLFKESPPKTSVCTALLDNIRSAWNVGAILRTADGLGVHKLYLCGITPTPVNKAVIKTALGAEKSIEWEYSNNALEKAKALKKDGYNLIALEQDKRAVPLITWKPQDLSHSVLVVGNEITGVDPELLDLCEHIVHIPMRGNKRSFNVEVAFAIAMYSLSKF